MRHSRGGFGGVSGWLEDGGGGQECRVMVRVGGLTCSVMERRVASIRQTPFAHMRRPINNGRRDLRWPGGWRPNDESLLLAQRGAFTPLPPVSLGKKKRAKKRTAWTAEDDLFFFSPILSHEFRIYSRAAAIWRLVTSPKCGCGSSSPYGTIKVILTFFFFLMLDGFHSRYFRRLQPVKKKRHLWAPSALTSIQIARHIFFFFFLMGRWEEHWYKSNPDVKLWRRKTAFSPEDGRAGLKFLFVK